LESGRRVESKAGLVDGAYRIVFSEKNKMGEREENRNRGQSR